MKTQASVQQGRTKANVHSTSVTSGGASEAQAQSIQKSSPAFVMKKSKRRGKLLEKRLKLLNQYLVQHENTKVPFGQFLSKKGHNMGSFMSALPDDHRFSGIDKHNLDSVEGRKKIREYTNDLNDLYIEQVVDYKLARNAQKRGADGEEEMYEARGGKKGFLGLGKGNRGGKKGFLGLGKGNRDGKKGFLGLGKGNRDKDAIKDARSDFKDAKKDLKDQWKSGKISKDEYQKRLKELRGEKRDTIKTAGGTLVGGIVRTANKFNPATVAIRNAALGVLKLNGLNLAWKTGKVKELSKSDSAIAETWKKIQRIWENFGGNVDAFNKEIERGKDKRPIFGRAKSEAAKEKKEKSKEHGGILGLGRKGGRRSADGEDGESYYNALGGEEVAALIVAGGTVLTPIIVAIAKHKDKIKGDPEDGVEGDNVDLPDTGDEIPIDPQTKEEIDKILADKESEGGDDDSIDAGGVMTHLKKNWGWYAGGFALTAILITVSVIKKKK